MNKMSRRKTIQPIRHAADTMKKVEHGQQLNVRIAPEVRTQLRIQAAKEDRSMLQIVEDAIRQYLEKNA